MGLQRESAQNYLCLLWLPYFTWHNVPGIIHIVAFCQTPFLCKPEEYGVVCSRHILTIRSSPDGYLGKVLVTVTGIMWVFRYLFETLLSLLLGVCADMELLDRALRLLLTF